ncbi:hypothetical protein M7I_7853 [Glarea lozoyensis 74030]|uniref:Uncharacterized protein n=1 Tax=Glarea lozoyensis (strain ATCC 74030 / MF5533) TaxID=1104152 RepID=H0EYF2_GLAL7|nr:hypothetical protein M7I_7853 [Glarea lozoyensis 74030]
MSGHNLWKDTCIRNPNIQRPIYSQRLAYHTRRPCVVLGGHSTATSVVICGSDPSTNQLVHLLRIPVLSVEVLLLLWIVHGAGSEWH